MNMSLLMRSLNRHRVPIKYQFVRNLAFDNILDDPRRSEFTMVSEFDEGGFKINKVYVRHPVILLPKHFLVWNTRSFEDINVASLDLFSYVYPTLELVLVGCGEKSSERLPRDVLEYFKYKGIVIEQMDSMNAVQTFNLLIAEGRNVGAAILPLVPFPEDEFGQDEDEFN